MDLALVILSLLLVIYAFLQCYMTVCCSAAVWEVSSRQGNRLQISHLSQWYVHISTVELSSWQNCNVCDSPSPLPPISSIPFPSLFLPALPLFFPFPSPSLSPPFSSTVFPSLPFPFPLCGSLKFSWWIWGSAVIYPTGAEARLSMHFCGTVYLGNARRYLLGYFHLQDK